MVGNKVANFDGIENENEESVREEIEMVDLSGGLGGD